MVSGNRVREHLYRGLAAYASSVSFGHTEQFFDSLDTQKFLSEFADDDFS